MTDRLAEKLALARAALLEIGDPARMEVGVELLTTDAVKPSRAGAPR